MNEKFIPVVVVNNFSAEPEVILCESQDQARFQIQELYLSRQKALPVLCEERTWISDEVDYAVVSDGALETEIFMGKITKGA